MRYIFPRPVCLPPDATISHCELRLALGGVSRALIYKWRKDHGFPAFTRDGRNSFSIVSDVEKWLKCNGVEVERFSRNVR